MNNHFRNTKKKKNIPSSTSMAEFEIPSPFLLLLLSVIVVAALQKLLSKAAGKFTVTVPETYPIIGSYLGVSKHRKDREPWMTELLRSSPTSTVAIVEPLWCGAHVVTSNPANVEHILKNKFAVYQKGKAFTDVLGDLLGHGIFNVNGEQWKFQRQVASYEFSTKSLRKFVEQVVDTELYDRLIPILAQSANTGKVFDLQDLLQRFAFDNICQIAFGYDAALLLPSLPESEFAEAFESAVGISSARFRSFLPITWQIKRFLNIGSEKQLRKSVSIVRNFATRLIKQKKQQIEEQRENPSPDLLSRFLQSGHSDEKFIAEIVISFILAGRDTTSSTLTWFFYLLSKNPATEAKIVGEINRIDENPKESAYDGTKDLVYTHAALFESMRLHPAVVEDVKQAAADDVWPDGTAVRKGWTVAYHVYAMGRMEGIWGEDWAEFRPERWLEEREEGEKKRRVFIGKDPYSYPVFQAGPRTCPGKDMAVLQMKEVVAGVLRRFRVVPAAAEGFVPELLPHLTAKIKGGFPVRFERRVLAGVEK